MNNSCKHRLLFVALFVPLIVSAFVGPAPAEYIKWHKAPCPGRPQEFPVEAMAKSSLVTRSTQGLSRQKFDFEPVSGCSTLLTHRLS
jgi:hypothetical protein